MSDKEEEKRECIGSLKIGDKITFGSYPFYEDGREKPIDWIILDIDADKNALVISDYCFDNVRYNEQYADITWENSTIRKWLNNDFLNKAFKETKQSKMITTTVSTAYKHFRSRCYTKGGNDTRDKLFLLSIEEAEKFFKDDESRIAYPTPYAKSKKSVNGNLYVDEAHVSTDRGGSCWWWLRSLGYFRITAANVQYNGHINSFGGDIVYYGKFAVRPAFKINLKNL